MQATILRFSRPLLLCFGVFQAFLARSQSSSESVYSDQAFDPIREKIWYEDPIIWLGALLVIALVYFWWRRRR